MGMTAELSEEFVFTYRAIFENGLTENEIDHVLVGYSNHLPKLNPDEAMDFKYMAPNHILLDIQLNPDQYTPWFKILMNSFGHLWMEKQAS
jgi:isopentenyl-diphosphate delta-isomerase